MEQETSAKILKGKPVAAEVMGELRAVIEKGVARTGRSPGLAVILVGDNPASQIYVRNKERAASKLGIRTFDHRLPEDVTQEKVLRSRNSDPASTS
jgi:methylenetetrahydrofolate dehydrogenase (NADP+)/methenyltetrahydrofolate cyclohydrolase